MRTLSATLLLVDDQPLNRDLLARRLERSGFEVLCAEGGEEALSLVNSRRVDLVLLDIMMPGVDGLEVLRRLRGSRNTLALPVIMVTAKDQSEDLVEALGLGANDYVTKPVDFPVVVARIQAALRNREAHVHREPAIAGPIGAGTIIGGRFRLESRIGGGTFGTVWRAEHLELHQPLALKILAANVSIDGDALLRFRREGISSCRVRHPNAVAISDFGATEEGIAYLAMELLDGHSLEHELELRGALEPGRCVRLGVAVLAALAEAHRQGIVHRDIKPANVFLHRGPKGEVPKVLDFGIARLLDEAAVARHITLDGSLLGTPAYMAPERFRNQTYGPKSDVYSAGVMLFQMISGRLPYIPRNRDPLALAVLQTTEEPPALRGLKPDVSLALERAVAAALARDPDVRPSADELGRLLRAAMPPLDDPFTPLDADGAVPL